MDPADLTPVQRDLWRTVERLWSLVGGDERVIRRALHPKYAGWAMDDDVPHDRTEGVRSAASGPPVVGLDLEPLSVQVYDRTGVVHYRYRATLEPAPGEARTVTGRWTEVYVGGAGTWLLVAVAGGQTPR